MFKKTLLGIMKIPIDTKYTAKVDIDKTRWSLIQKKTIKDFELNSRAFRDLIIAMDGSLNTGKVA